MAQQDKGTKGFGSSLFNRKECDDYIITYSNIKCELIMPSGFLCIFTIYGACSGVPSGLSKLLEVVQSRRSLNKVFHTNHS